jgi:cytoskeletal protein RodZ
MACCNSDKGCSSSASAPKDHTTDTTSTANANANANANNMKSVRSSSRFSSGRSLDSNSNASSPPQEESAIRGTSNVLAMLPAGKSCCAESAIINADCGNTGVGTSSGNNNTNMNETSNVLVQYTLQDLDRRAESNFWLGLLCLMVCSINVVLFYLVRSLM